MFLRLFLGLALVLAPLQNVWSAQADDSSKVAQLASLASRIKYETGVIPLRSGLATIKLTEDFLYINPAGTETILNGIWGNPPSSEKPLGMIVPKGFNAFDEKSWCVVLSYDEDGYIKDHDAETIDYNDLLKEMKEGSREANAERAKEGYPTVELVGWATPPKYDRATHKFVWAKELKFEGSEGDNTLNYNLRVLGRRGVLVLNAVSNMSDLSKIEDAAPKILSMVDFDPGNRYTDYQPGTDKVATYGLAALVAGGIAAKSGLLKGILLALLAMKKFVVIAVIAVLSFVKRLFGGKSRE